ASCRPVVTSAMNAAASRMSSSSFGERGCIHRLARAHCGFDEVRVAHGVGHDQINRTSEQCLQRLLQCEIVKKELLLCRGPEIDDEVDVAFVRVEVIARGRPEYVQSPHTMCLAQAGDIVATGIDEFGHGHDAEI